MTWEPTSTVTEEWGRLQVVINNVDCTYVNGARTLIDSLSWGEPYGESAGSLTFPNVTEFSGSGPQVGQIWRNHNVDIWHVLPSGLRRSFWHGFIISVEIASGSGVENAVTAHMLGALSGEASFRMHQPYFLDKAADCGVHIGRALNPRAYVRPLPGYRFKFTTDDTGIDIRIRGSRSQSVLEFCDEVLALAQGGQMGVSYDLEQWTVSRVFTDSGAPRARRYMLRKKSVEKATFIEDKELQRNTVSLGAPGVEAQLTADFSEQYNVIYGEGVDPETGERWRNAKYPGIKDNVVPPYPTRVSGSGPIQMMDADSDFTTDAITRLQAELKQDGWPSVRITGIFDERTLDAVQTATEALTGTEYDTVNSSRWDLIFAKSNGTKTDLSSAYFQPLAQMRVMDPWTYYSDGSIKGNNDQYMPEIIRVERTIAYGEGVSKKAAIHNARRLIKRDAKFDQDWSGTVTLRMDPEERSRLDIREGGRLVVKNMWGGTTNLYIAGVEVKMEEEGMPVTLTVDKRNTDLLELSRRLERNRESRKDPARALFSMRGRSSSVFKDVTGWDGESGAGTITPRGLVAGWNVIRFVGAQYGTVEAIEAYTSGPATKYALALFGSRISAAKVTDLVPKPLSKDASDYGWWSQPSIQSELTSYGFIEAWGEYDQAAGYWPGAEDRSGKKTTHPVTGVMKDSLSWTFASTEPPWLYLAVWVPNSCTFRAEMRVTIDDGL